MIQRDTYTWYNGSILLTHIHMPSEENKKENSQSKKERKQKRKKIPNQKVGESKKRKKIPDQGSEENRRNMQKGLWTRQYGQSRIVTK